MRCSEVHERIVEGLLEGPAQAHLSACPTCQAFARDLRSLQAGFEFLARQAPPEPSWGFAARVLRRLDEAPPGLIEPLEIVARRAVLAAGALAMTAMMAFVLSSSGPLRGGGSQSFSLARADSSETVETLLAGGIEESEELNLLPVTLNGADSR